jgi:hypothetical protein
VGEAQRAKDAAAAKDQAEWALQNAALLRVKVCTYLTRPNTLFFSTPTPIQKAEWALQNAAVLRVKVCTYLTRPNTLFFSTPTPIQKAEWDTAGRGSGYV